MTATAKVCGYGSSDPTVRQLEDEITELAAHIQAATCRLLELLCEFDEREGWAGPGLKSCAHWLNWRCGINLGAAREKLRVAHALADLPAITAAFRRGELSYSKVRAVTRIATPETEEYLLQIARSGTAAHVERLVSCQRRLDRIEANEQAEAQRQAREVHWHFDEDDCLVLRARLPKDQGQQIVRALEAAVDQQPLEGEPEPIAARRADALEQIALDSLAGSGKAVHGGDRYTLNVHTTRETLTQDGAGTGSELEGQGHVSAETTRRLACDCGTIHHESDESGQPLNVGRRTRTIPPSLRRALQRRDGGCRFPGCTHSRHLDGHHIRHWADGGETSLENVVLLCTRHHRLLHEGGYQLTGHPSADLTFRDPHGKPIPDVPETRFRGNADALINHNRRNGLQLHRLTLLPDWHGEPFDYDTSLIHLKILRNGPDGERQAPDQR